MEFDIGNLLYVIITIVAIAIGLLGRKKKPAQQRSGEPGQERKPGFFENLERVLNQDAGSGDFYEVDDTDNEIKEEEKEVPVLVAEEEHTGGGILEEYERMRGRTKESPAASVAGVEADLNTEQLEVIHLDEDDGTDYFEVVAEFNAATAVVYSAIINRIDY